MPNPVIPLPDDELAIILYLGSIAEVTSLVPAAQISTELPPNPVYPHVTISRIGGNVTGYWQTIDEPAHQVDVFGDLGTKAECKRIILALRAAILSIANDVVESRTLPSGYVFPGATLVSSSEEVGPQWLPDSVEFPPLPRYVARFRLLLHA